MQFAQRYRLLGEAIEATRARLADARARKRRPPAHLAEVETTLERLRLELTEADARTTAAREAAHARELSIGRLQQQVAFDKQQVESLGAAALVMGAEIEALEARRAPARVELAERRAAAERAVADRQHASEALAAEEEAYALANRTIEGLESDVEAARSEVYAAVNAATALRHAMEHAAAARARIGEQLAKLDVERNDLAVEAQRAADERAAAEEALRRSREAMETLHVDRAARESELSVARSSREALGRDVRTREHELAGVVARLKSLGGARRRARRVRRRRPHDPGRVRRRRARSSDPWPTTSRLTRSTSAPSTPPSAISSSTSSCARTPTPPPASSSSASVRGARRLRRCRRGPWSLGPWSWVPGRGSLVLGPWACVPRAAFRARRPKLSAACWRTSRRGRTSRVTMPRHWRSRPAATAVTRDGEVFRGAHRVEGGARDDARSILTTKREIKELRERADAEDATLVRMLEEAGGLDVAIASAESAIASLQAELHRQEKAIVGYDLQVTTAGEASDRVARKQEQITVERRSADEELRTQEQREEEARQSIQRIETEQRAADEQLSTAQRRLFEARETAASQSRVTAEAKAAHAALVERSSALAIEVQRLEDAARELEERVVTRSEELQRNVARREELREGIAASERQLDEDLRTFDDLREQVKTADEASQELRGQFESQEVRIRDARRALEGVRDEASHLEVQRATAESDLGHLATSCVDTVQASLDEVAAEVAQMEQDGLLASPKAVGGHAGAGGGRGAPGARAQGLALPRRSARRPRLPARSRPTRWCWTSARRSSGWAP